MKEIKEKIMEILVRIQNEAPKRDVLINKITYNANQIQRAVEELNTLIEEEKKQAYEKGVRGFGKYLRTNSYGYDGYLTMIKRDEETYLQQEEDK